MYFVLRLLLIAAITYLLGWQFPQWAVWPVPVGAGIIGLLLAQSQQRNRFGRRKPPKAFAFLAGFLGAGLVWVILSWQIDLANASRLSRMMAEILFQQADYAWALVAITGLMGALLGGFGAMTGNLLGEAIRS